MAEIVEDNLATKQDIRDLRDEMQKIEYRMTIKMGVMTTIAVSVLVAILKTHP